MSRVRDIINLCRIDLLDTQKTRWADSTLLSLLSAGQRDITLHTQCLRDIIPVNLVPGVHTYTLPEDTVQVTYCTFKNRRLPLKTTAYMDKRGTISDVVSLFQKNSNYTFGSILTDRSKHWMAATTNGDIMLVIFDKLKRRQLRVWPTPINPNLQVLLTESDEAYGVVVDGDEYTVQSPYLGVTSEVFFDDNQEAVFDPDSYGEVTEVVQVSEFLVHRAKLSATLTSLDQELEVDLICDRALQHYVVGHAYRQDTIAENRAKGTEELSFYGRELEMIAETVKENGVSSEHHDTVYNPMGD